jgi:AbrB family looped-hinge helix DNA binding protein
MAESAKVSTKGQLVIPAKLREELGFKAGVRVFFTKQGKGLLIEPSRFDALRALRGSLANYPLEKDLMHDPIRDRG